MIEIRHQGALVARFATEEQAGVWLAAHPDLEGLASAEGRAFEVHCEDGFCDSFHSTEDAEAYIEAQHRTVTVDEEGKEMVIEHAPRFKQYRVRPAAPPPELEPEPEVPRSKRSRGI